MPIASIVCYKREPNAEDQGWTWLSLHVQVVPWWLAHASLTSKFPLSSECEARVHCTAVTHSERTSATTDYNIGIWMGAIRSVQTVSNHLPPRRCCFHPAAFQAGRVRGNDRAAWPEVGVNEGGFSWSRDTYKFPLGAVAVGDSEDMT